MKIRFHWKYLLLILGICYIGFLVFYVGELPHRDAKFNNEECIYLKEGWEYITETGEISYLNTPFDTKPNRGDELEISYKLPEQTVQTTNTFATWTGMIFLDVYLDGELIYKHENETSYGKVEGSGWLVLRLPEEWQGKTLTLRMASPYPEYLTEFKNFLLGSKASILFEIIHMYWADLLLSFLLLFMGSFLMIMYLFIRRLLSGERGIAYLGWFQILMGVWMFTESRATQFFMNNILITNTLTYISLLMLPVPLLLYLLENMKSSKGKIAVNIMIGLHTMTGILILVLHTLGIKTMYEMLLLSHSLIVVSAIVLVTVSAVENIVYKNRPLRFIGYSVLILSIGGLGELFAFYSGTRLLVGTFMKIGTVICMIMISIIVIRKALSVVRISSEAVYYEKLALLDFMTQCQNRTAYQRELEKENKKVFDKENVTIVLADLNNLKQMNDKLGHHVGDAAIKLCGKLILQIFRPYGKCFRVGGDEFACIINNCDNAMLKDMVKEFQQLCEQENKEWKSEFAVAIGYAVFDKKLDHCLEDTIKRADRAMYENKYIIKVNAQNTAEV